MYYTLSSSLVLVFLIFLFHSLPCASSTPEWCETLFQCGNITAGFPFWGRNRLKHCNNPLLELHCNSQNITSLNLSTHIYHVIHIDQASDTLTLASENLQGPFCSAEFTNATFPSEIFELSPTYKNLTVFYHCDPYRRYYLSYSCLKLGPTSVSESPEFPEGCHDSLTVYVPKSFNTSERNLKITNLESALRKGFDVKVKIGEKACQECSLHNSPGLSTGAKSGIAFAGVGILILIAAPLLLCTARRRKKTKEAQYTSKHLPVTSYSNIAAASGMVGKCQRKTSNDLEQKYLKSLIPLKHYSYAQVKRITKSFTEVVGKGGFGTVYKGILCDGRSVAVKILKDSKGNGEDFINEVASMSKTSHVNIVSLLGFCSEGSKRAIIYEYMENGSLDQYISRNTSMNIDWMILYGIALGVARGLEYLHHGCKTRIVHFDIKPQNVLLDDNLCPKVSDFGLAKLCEKKESILSLLDTRGTVGYIAPEVFSRMYGRVSYKSDVYSYGMLVIEMIGARKKTSTENSASNPSSMYFPEWIYKEFEKGDKGKLYGNGITCEEDEIVKKMKLVGLWCIQPSPSDRPPMNKVVEMMEGNLNALEVPPRPVLQIPAAPLLESSTLSEDISVYTEV